MPKCSPTDLSSLTLPDLDSIAKETGMIIRESKKFAASEFLQSLLSAVTTGKASLNQIASALGLRMGVSLCKQAMGERFDDASTAFLTRVAHELIAQPVESASSSLDTCIFNRILIEDSSFCPVSGANAQEFPAHGNGKTATAGVKVDLVYDLLTAGIASFDLHHATEQDKTLGKDLVDSVRPKDLVLRDMGYFVVSEFARIERLGAYWLSRLPSHTGVALADGRCLEQLLRSTTEHRLELDVTISNAGHRCRLVAVRAESKVTRERRRERRGKSTDPKHLFHTRGWIRDGWHLLLTNIAPEEASLETLFKIYRMRWDIEIQFRGWKQSTKLDEALDRDTGEDHLMGLILAAMIHQILGLRLRQHFESFFQKATLSMEKLFSLVGQFHNAAKRFENIVDFNPDCRHIRKDKRRRPIPVAVGIAALS